jgi:hypothetical protein
VSRRAALAPILSLYVALATAMGFVDYNIRQYPERGFKEYTPEVLEGRAVAPAKYRIFGPQAYAFVGRMSHLPTRETWVLFRWLCLFGSLLAFHVYLSTWFDRGWATAGSILAMALLPLTFANSWAHPDHLTELLLFTLGCLCIARRWDLAFAGVLLANALNRETSLFLVPLYFLAQPATVRHVAKSAAFGGLWVAVYVGLRWYFGYGTYDASDAIGNNIKALTLQLLGRDYPPYHRLFGWFFAALAIPLAWMTVSTWKSQPRFAKVATAIVAPAVLLLGFLISSFVEPRIFTPLLPLLIPGALRALSDGTPRAPEHTQSTPPRTPPQS